MRDAPPPGPGRLEQRADRVAEDPSAVGQILAQQAAVAEIGQRALGETRLERLLHDAAVLVARTLGCDLVSILELTPEGDLLRLVAGIGWQDGIVGDLTLRSDTGSMAGYTLATGGPVIVEDLRRETRFSVSSVLLDHRALSGMSVRIGELEHPFGALAAFTSRLGHYTSDDANFLQAVANVLAGAIARLRVEGELRRSRDQLAAIVSGVTDGITVQRPDGQLVFANDAAARLTGYATADELMGATVNEVMQPFELLGPDGQPLPVEALPGRRAMSGEPVPETLVRFRIRASGEERWSLVRATPVHADDGSVAHIINVFRDITLQQKAEDARRFLADALAAITTTLDTAEAARRLAESCVPALADCAIVDVLEADGSIHTAALVHREGAQDPDLARELVTFSLADDAGPGWVIREGRAREGPADELTPAGREECLPMAHYLSVPLVAQGRSTGALTVMRTEALRTYGADEHHLLEELGVRAGPAIENARLYEAVDDRRAELDAVLTAMAEAVLVFDPRGRLRLSNPAAARTFGGAVPRSMTELAEKLTSVDEHDRPLVVTDMSEHGTDVQLRGSSRWLELRRYRAARTGADRGQRHAPSVVVLRDVTDARAARAARDAFMGVLSHELRTPITTIYGGSQLLERGMDDERRMEVVRDIRAESERLARLIEDLLVMTRVERGGVEIGDEPVLVQRLLPPLVDSMAARWPRLRVDLLLDESLPAVRGDATYLEQVLRNLMTNAVRYGEALESGLTVRAHEGDGEVVVRVLDRGPGMAGEDPEQLFDLFYRAASARGVPGGAGIGLFVCRQLVEAMGGRIWAQQRQGGGSDFSFALPIIDADIG